MVLASNSEISASSPCHDGNCPPWCEQEHLGRMQDPLGFHHDSEVARIVLEFAEESDQPTDLFVNVSQHVQAAAAPEPVLIEVQDALHSLLLLTPTDCVRLSRALLESADVAGVATADEQYADELKDLLLTMCCRLERADASGHGRSEVPRGQQAQGRSSGSWRTAQMGAQAGTTQGRSRRDHGSR